MPGRRSYLRAAGLVFQLTLFGAALAASAVGGNDDGAALVREVLAEAPSVDRGEREEWSSHEGWHRKENVHLGVHSGGTDKVGESNDPGPRHEPDPGRPHAKSQATAPHAPLHATPKHVGRDELRAEAKLREMIHGEVLREEAAEVAAAMTTAAGFELPAATAGRAGAASDSGSGGSATAQQRERFEDAERLPGSTGAAPAPDVSTDLPRDMPRAAGPGLRGARREVILPSTGPYPEEEVARGPGLAAWGLAAAGLACLCGARRRPQRGGVAAASAALSAASSACGACLEVGADVSTTSERRLELKGRVDPGRKAA